MKGLIKSHRSRVVEPHVCKKRKGGPPAQLLLGENSERSQRLGPTLSRIRRRESGVCRSSAL